MIPGVQDNKIAFAEVGEYYEQNNLTKMMKLM